VNGATCVSRSHTPSSGGAFGTPAIDGMMQASLEKRARSVAAL